MGKLGSYRPLIQKSETMLPLHTYEAARLAKYGLSLSNLLYAARTVGLRSLRRLVGQYGPGRLPESAIRPDFVHRADMLDALAQSTGIDAAGLQRTVTRFNEMARKGHDEDFGRGGNSYDRWFGDPTVKPNPNLGALEKAPFYAVR
ncbi:hypothetical protein RBB50_003534 [Rhinocladiella similis]